MAISLNTRGLILLIFGIYSWSVFSQERDSVVANYINQLSSVFNSRSSVTFNEVLNPPNSDLSAILPFYSSVSANTVYTDKLALQQKINREEQMIYKKDPGFSMIAVYQKNFKSPIADPEDIVIFKQKFQAGFQWDLLRSGLYESRSKIRQLQYREKGLQWQMTHNLSSLVLKNNFNMVVYLLNEEKIKVLEQRRAFVQSFVETTKQLLSLNQVSKENYIKVQQHLNDIEYQLNVYQYYNRVHENLKLSKPSKVVLPVFDIDYNKITEQLVNKPVFDSAAYYNLEAAAAQNYLLKEMSLSTNVKYNFYDVYNSNVPNRTYVSLGVNLSVPLAMNQKNKKQRDVLTAQLINGNLTDRSGMDTQNVILNSLYEFRYKQKQYANLLQKRELFSELLRNEEVKYHYGSVEFNPLTANLILDDYWSTTIELLDLKQDMYRLLNELKLNLTGLEVSSIIKPISYEPVQVSADGDHMRKEFKTVNAVYIWSDVFKTNTVPSVINYCKLNNFNTLVVSINKSNVTQVNQLIELGNNFNVELMISNNNLVTNGRIESYLDSLLSGVKVAKVAAIHLDIEPHTMEGFKDDKEAFFEKYLELLSKASSIAKKNNVKLNVSIPLNYPENVLAKVFGLCDLVYLMAYENVKASFIKEKTKEEVTLGEKKIVLALRTKDFKNKAQMDALQVELGFKNAAYHDLDDLMKWSRTNVIKGQGK